jgi:uracil permease
MITYAIVALLVWKMGPQWIEKILPPIVIGPVVAVIGLSLAGSAISYAFTGSSAAPLASSNFSWASLLLAVITLGGIAVAMFGKNRFINSISILVGVVIGYVISAILSACVPSVFGSFYHLNLMANGWITPPRFVPAAFGSIHWATAGIVAVSFVITSFATIIEHIGHTIVTGDIIGKDVVKDPGLHRTILGDGVATGVAGLFGSVCNTTYGESLGVMATTKVYSVVVFVAAACFAIVLSFVGPFAAIIQAIPGPVLGGACILLYGTIASNGLKQLVINHIDFDDSRNMFIVSVVFILGVGGSMIPVAFNGSPLTLLSAIALSALVGIILNAVLPKPKAVAAK